MKFYKTIYVFILLFLIILPYYLFQGKLFIGGDDTRLMYIYPYEWIKNISFFSWYNLSSIGFNNPNQFSLPFLSIIFLIKLFIKDLIHLNYFVFSLPYILGFVFFERFLKTLSLDKNDENLFPERILASLFFILSPILNITIISNFLYSVWLIGYIPVFLLLFIKYLKTHKNIYLFINFVTSFIFSIAIYGIPWILGFFLPVCFGFFFFIFLNKGKIIYYSKSIINFIFFTFLSQIFWIIPFLFSIFQNTQEHSRIINATKNIDAFYSTVIATSNGNNIYFPLMNLFHRQIVFGFNWTVSSVYTEFYDKHVYIGFIFVVIIAFAILNYKKYLNKQHTILFLLFFLSFLFSLFLFTVNIYPFKDMFLFLGNFPGFPMFKNFYDKFALGFVLLYSVIIYYGAVIISRKYSKHRHKIIILFLLTIILNFSHIKGIINSPMWTTQKVLKNINISKEYLNFMSKVSSQGFISSNIFTVPLNVASYEIIKDTNSNSVYAGTSPVKIFTGRNDFSGNLSFSDNVTNEINELILKKKYKEINSFFIDYNIGYIFLTKNIPNEVLSSYLFNKTLLKTQDASAIKNLTHKKLFSSSNKNFEFYSTKTSTTILDSKNTYFLRKNPVKYELLIKNISSRQNIVFKDSFNTGWKIFLSNEISDVNCNKFKQIEVDNIRECEEKFSYLDLNDISFSFRRPAFDETHKLYKEFGNVWTIDPEVIRSKFSSNIYSVNPDGSINLLLVLYFVPQNYFYIGTIIFIGSFIFLMYRILSKNEK